jgi:hypothetical protein
MSQTNPIGDSVSRERDRRTGTVGGGLLAAVGVMAATFIAFAALFTIPVLLVGTVSWFAGAVSPFIGAIGWWVGVPLLLYGAYETVVRVRASAGRRSAGAVEETSADSRGRRSILCVGAATAIVAGNLAINIAASRIEAHWNSTRPMLAEIYTNHDLARLVGECVGARIRLFARGATSAVSQGQSEVIADKMRDDLDAMADIAPDRWFRLATEPQDDGAQTLLPITDDTLLVFMGRTADSALKIGEWTRLLFQWRDEAEASSVDDHTIGQLASFIASDISSTFREALKEDYVRGGKAWPAIQLDIALRLLTASTVASRLSDEEFRRALGPSATRLEGVAADSQRINELIAQARQSVDSADQELADRFADALAVIQQVSRDARKAAQELDGEPAIEGFRFDLYDPPYREEQIVNRGGRFPRQVKLAQGGVISAMLRKSVMVWAVVIRPDGELGWIEPAGLESIGSPSGALTPPLAPRPVNGEFIAPRGASVWRFDQAGPHALLLLAFEPEATPSSEALRGFLQRTADSAGWRTARIADTWIGRSSGLTLADRVRGLEALQSEPASLVALLAALQAKGNRDPSLGGLRDFSFCAFEVLAPAEVDGAAAPRN